MGRNGNYDQMVNGSQSENIGTDTSPTHHDMLATRGHQSSQYVKKKKTGINYGFLTSLLLTVSMGMVQFGYAIGSWNATQNAYARYRGWTGDDKSSNIKNTQTLIFAGAMVSSISSGALLSIGRWNCIFLTNFLVIIGAGLTLVPSTATLYTGMAIYGMAAGAYSVFCPKYISEVAPTEVKGVAGTLSQIACCFGIMVCFSAGLGIGDVKDDVPDTDSFAI